MSVNAMNKRNRAIDNLEGRKIIYTTMIDVYNQFMIPLINRIEGSHLLGNGVFIIKNTMSTIEIQRAQAQIPVAIISVRSVTYMTDILTNTDSIPKHYDDLYIELMVYKKNGDTLRRILFLSGVPPNFHEDNRMKLDHVFDLQGDLKKAENYIFDTLAQELNRYLLEPDYSRLVNPPFLQYSYPNLRQRLEARNRLSF
jgi:hypothetical protein